MNDREFEDLVRQVLAEDASSVQITGDGLERIRARTGRARAAWQWWPAMLGAVATAAVAGVAFAVLTGSPDSGPEVASGGATPTVTTTPSPVPSDSPRPSGSTVAIPVYYVQETSAGLRLNREFHVRPAVVGTALATDALTEMLSGAADDPDLSSLWNRQTRVLSVTRADGLITVDLSGEASTNTVGSETAELAVQQLVYTVTAALQANEPVRLLVEGRSVDLWGHVSTADPIRRANPLAVRNLVQLNDPAEGAVVTGEITVSGEAAVYEATLPWRLLQDGVEVEAGFTTTAEGQRFAPFSFRLGSLTPGTYTIMLVESDPSGGEGRAPMTDANTFTVR